MTEQENGNGNGKVAYTVRELLAEIKLSLSMIDNKLDNKAEKSVVDNLEKRLTTMEAERNSQLTYGNQLLAEFRALQGEQVKVGLAINTLETNKRDKSQFNVMMIPVVFNSISIILGAFYFFVLHH